MPPQKRSANDDDAPSAKRQKMVSTQKSGSEPGESSAGRVTRSRARARQSTATKPNTFGTTNNSNSQKLKSEESQSRNKTAPKPDQSTNAPNNTTPVDRTKQTIPNEQQESANLSQKINTSGGGQKKRKATAQLEKSTDPRPAKKVKATTVSSSNAEKEVVGGTVEPEAEKSQQAPVPEGRVLRRSTRRQARPELESKRTAKAKPTPRATPAPKVIQPTPKFTKPTSKPSAKGARSKAPAAPSQAAPAVDKDSASNGCIELDSPLVPQLNRGPIKIQESNDRWSALQEQHPELQSEAAFSFATRNAARFFALDLEAEPERRALAAEHLQLEATGAPAYSYMVAWLEAEGIEDRLKQKQRQLVLDLEKERKATEARRARDAAKEVGVTREEVAAVELLLKDVKPGRRKALARYYKLVAARRMTPRLRDLVRRAAEHGIDAIL